MELVGAGTKERTHWKRATCRRKGQAKVGGGLECYRSASSVQLSR